MSMILYNGKVYLEKNNFAEAIYIDGNIIKDVGTNEAILAHKTEDMQLIDVGGKTVIPGLNDSHAHVLFMGNYLNSVQLLGTKCIDDVIQRGREFLKTHTILPGQVLMGQGWNQEQFPENERRFLTRHDLDQISTKVPIIFARTCGHVTTCNTKALEVGGFTADTPQVEGGEFEVDEDGQPNGVFKELADRELRRRVVPLPTQETIEQDMITGMDYMASLGITSIQSMNLRELRERDDVFSVILKLRDENRLTMRIYEQNYCVDADSLESYVHSDFYKNLKQDNFYKQGAVKTFLDGSLGGRTALMKRDYADMPGERGMHAVAPDEFRKIVETAHKYGLQVVVHAIGDEAIGIALEAYASVNEPGKNPLRHSVIHCQITDYSMLRRFKETDTVAIVQPVFLNSDWSIVEPRVGKDLAKYCYAFKTLSNLGVHIALGTDAPTEDSNPFECIYCAITRKDLKGNPKGGFYPEEGLDIWEAVDGYTIGSAYASFDENIKGRIKEGYLADLAVLSDDIFTISSDNIKDIKVEMTVVDGKIVYQRNK